MSKMQWLQCISYCKLTKVMEHQPVSRNLEFIGFMVMLAQQCKYTIWGKRSLGGSRQCHNARLQQGKGGKTDLIWMLHGNKVFELNLYRLYSYFLPPVSPGSISRLSAGPSWILRTTATRPCRRPPPTSTRATLGPQKRRMTGKCPVTPSGCGSLCWRRLATSWWWRWFVPVPSDKCGSKHSAAVG